MDATPVKDVLGTPVQDVISTPAKHGTSPGWGHIAQLQTPASVKRRDAKQRVHRFARAGKQQAPGQGQAAGPTAQSILSVKRTLSFNACRENVQAGTNQHPPISTMPQNVLKALHPSSCGEPEQSDIAAVPTTFAACYAEAAAKDSAAGGAQKSRHNQTHLKFQANKNRGVRDGGHENFVRLASKKGKSSFTYKSKSGSSNKNLKNRKWAARKMAAESLPVAGLGADSTKEAHLVCFKCGQKGHWAADCKSELPTGQKENINMAWCVTDTAVLDTQAGPLPAFLRADAVATLAAHGAVSGAYLAQGAQTCTDLPIDAPSVEPTGHKGGDQPCEKEVGTEGSAVAAPNAPLVESVEAHGLDASISQQPSAAVASDVAGPSSRAACEQPCLSRPVSEGQKQASVDDTLRTVLKDAFGFEDFRSFQLPVIRKLLQKESCMVVQPTGSGKSLCFQLPSLLLPGLVIVVSPLTAHARDAVSRLPKSVPAGLCLGGDFKRASMATLAAAEAGRLKLLYITPECLATSWVADRLCNTHISLVCVDEAHVASAMSPSCRAGCLRLPTLVPSLAPDAARLLLTATAAPAMRSDLASVFGVTCSSIWTAPPVRPELTMRVEKHPGSAGDGRAHSAVLAALCPNGPLSACKCTLVYCTFCAHAEQLASYLQGRGVAAASYHGSLSGVARQSVAKRLAAGELRVVTCTTALSSGLDLHNIDGILHHTMPASLEDYVQQIGRAGRAGQPANALVMLRDADLHLLHSLKHSSDCDLRAVRTVLRVVAAAAAKAEITPAAKKAASKAQASKARASKKAANSEGGTRKRGKKGALRTDDPEDVEDGADALPTGGQAKGQKRKRSQRKPAVLEESEDDSDIEALFAAEELAMQRRVRSALHAGTPSATACDGIGEAGAVGDAVPTSGENGQRRRSSRLVQSGDACPAVQPCIDDLLEDDVALRDGHGGGVGARDVLEDSDSDAECDSEDEDDESDYEEQRAPQKRSRGPAVAASRRKHAAGERKMESSAPAIKGARAPAAGCSASECATADVSSPGKMLAEVDTGRDDGDHAAQANGMVNDVGGNGSGGSRDTKAGAAGVRHGHRAHGSYVVLQLRDTAQEAQITLDAIQTMLALLERVAPDAVRVLGNVMPAFKVACYKRKAEELAEREPLFAAIQSVARVRNGTLSAKMQDVARAAHVAPDAVEDLLQRLAAKGEVHLEGKRDFSVALWVDLEAGVWQGISGQAQPVGKAEETSSLARNVLAQMSSLQSTMVSKLELAYKALNSTQQLPPGQQSDALTACISREFPAHVQDAPGDVAEGGTCKLTAGYSEVGTVAAKVTPSEGEGPLQRRTATSTNPPISTLRPCEEQNREEPRQAPCANASEGTELGQQDLPFEPVGKMTSIRVAATVEHAAERAGEQVQLTARAIASIMHGRDTPSFPRSAWSKCPGWGSCMHVRFAELRSAAQKELLKQAGGTRPR